MLSNVVAVGVSDLTLVQLDREGAGPRRTAPGLGERGTRRGRCTACPGGGGGPCEPGDAALAPSDPEAVVVLGDAWERSYGELQWRGGNPSGRCRGWRCGTTPGRGRRPASGCRYVAARSPGGRSTPTGCHCGWICAAAGWRSGRGTASSTRRSCAACVRYRVTVRGPAGPLPARRAACRSRSRLPRRRRPAVTVLLADGQGARALVLRADRDRADRRRVRLAAVRPAAPAARRVLRQLNEMNADLVAVGENNSMTAVEVIHLYPPMIFASAARCFLVKRFSLAATRSVSIAMVVRWSWL